MAKPKEKEKVEDIADTMTTGGELAVNQQGSTDVELYDAGEDAGAGMEDISMDERRIPILRILDPKSPQCKPVANGGQGAKGGMLINTATTEIFDGELGGEFVPCYRDQKFVEWIAKNKDGSGGGFVATHEPDEPLVQALRAKHGKFGKLPMGMVTTTTKEGEEVTRPHELAQTFYLYGIWTPYRLDAEGKKYASFDESFRCMIPFGGMQIKKYVGFIDRYDNIRYDGRKADGTMGKIKPALWAHRLAMTTRYEERGAQNWYGWVITFAEKNPDGTEADKIKSRLSIKDDRYIEAKEFFKLIEAGEVKGDYKADAAEGESQTGNNYSGETGAGDDKFEIKD